MITCVVVLLKALLGALAGLYNVSIEGGIFFHFHRFGEEDEGYVLDIHLWSHSRRLQRLHMLHLGL